MKMWLPRLGRKRPGVLPRPLKRCWLYVEELERREMLTVQALTLHAVGVLSLPVKDPAENLMLATVVLDGTPDGSLTGAIDWGDGNPCDATIGTSEIGITVQGAHQYTAVGVFDIHITVSVDGLSQDGTDTALVYGGDVAA